MNPQITQAFYIVSGVAQLIVGMRWLYRRFRNEEIARAFVRDMATNHLPHIYDTLEKLAKDRGTDIGERPPVQFLDLNGKSDHAK